MRQIRLALVMVWLAGCGSSNTTSVDAPSSTPDSPTSGGADAPRPADARVADSPTGGSADAPAATPDAPVVTPDAPVETPDAPDVTPDAPAATADASLCGNGVVDPGEACDTAILAGEGACPTSCSSVDLCTSVTLTGGGTCNATCASQAVAATNDDGLCCPPATSGNDNDCVNTGFRITSLVLEDPHVYTSLLSAGASCDDITTTVNGAIATDLASDDGHGNLSLSPVAAFEPVNSAPDGTTSVELVLASCTSGATPTCTADNTTKRFGPATSTNSGATATDPCLDVIADTHNANYDDIVLPAPACTSAPFGTIDLAIPVSVPNPINPSGPPLPGTLFLSLEDVSIAATYHPSGTAANDQLVSGMLRGFLTHTSAKNMGTHPSRLEITGITSFALEGFLAGGMGNCKGAAIDDTDVDMNASDHDGWYFYLTFDAVKTPFTDTP